MQKQRVRGFNDDATHELGVRRGRPACRTGSQPAAECQDVNGALSLASKSKKTRPIAGRGHRQNLNLHLLLTCAAPIYARCIIWPSLSAETAATSRMPLPAIALSGSDFVRAVRLPPSRDRSSTRGVLATGSHSRRAVAADFLCTIRCLADAARVSGDLRSLQFPRSVHSSRKVVRLFLPRAVGYDGTRDALRTRGSSYCNSLVQLHSSRKVLSVSLPRAVVKPSTCVCLYE